jgi:NADH-quinone oxidoreductase subunit J
LTWETVIFYLAAVLTIGSALMVAFSRRLINAGFALLATFGGVAILYGLLGASFLAGTQVLLYIGGILVLLLFAIVLTRDMEHARISMTGFQKLMAVIIAAVTAVVFWIALSGTEWVVHAPDFAGVGPKGIGRLFMSEYILPFEAISVLLLIALVGAGYMVRRKS